MNKAPGFAGGYLQLAAEVAASAPFKEGQAKTGDFSPSTPDDALAEFWAYGARPLNGIWATGPFLAQWLRAQPLPVAVARRSAGRNVLRQEPAEFDPVTVGFETEEVPGAFLFDTSQPGNSNAGHEFGTKLSDTERWELIEYLKTL